MRRARGIYCCNPDLRKSSKKVWKNQFLFMRRESYWYWLRESSK